MRNPLRVFEGNAKPYEPFWRLVDAAKGDSGEPEMIFTVTYRNIPGSTMTSRQKIQKRPEPAGQRRAGDDQINSGGGEVFAASVIRSMR